MTFTVQATNWRILAVPQYHQAHGLSCEAAALRMASERSASMSQRTPC
jgi:hypothetical protein